MSLLIRHPSDSERKRRSDDLVFLAAFARYEDRLVVDGKNRGECGVLALGATRGHEVVLDDSVARQIAQEEGLRVTSTLALLCTAIRDGQLTVPMVEKLADDLIAGAITCRSVRVAFGTGLCRKA